MQADRWIEEGDCGQFIEKGESEISKGRIVVTGRGIDCAVRTTWVEPFYSVTRTGE